MEPQLEQCSIVLVAHQHNPSLLNPDFLKRTGIVPEAWKPRGQTITTEIFAQVTFAEGVQITSEPDKVAISVAASSIKRPARTAADLAQRFVETLPHVPYSAVGINAVYSHTPDGGDTNQLLVEGALHSKLGALAYEGVKPHVNATLGYALEDVKVNLSVNSGRVAREGKARAAVLFSVNGHHDLVKGEGAKAALGALATVEDRMGLFEKIIANLTEGG